MTPTSESTRERRAKCWHEHRESVGRTRHFTSPIWEGDTISERTYRVDVYRLRCTDCGHTWDVQVAQP